MEDYYKIPEFKVNFKSNISLPSYEDFDNLNEEKNILENIKHMKILKSLKINYLMNILIFVMNIWNLLKLYKITWLSRYYPRFNGRRMCSCNKRI